MKLTALCLRISSIQTDNVYKDQRVTQVTLLQTRSFQGSAFVLGVFCASVYIIYTAHHPRASKKFKWSRATHVLYYLHLFTT